MPCPKSPARFSTNKDAPDFRRTTNPGVLCASRMRKHDYSPVLLIETDWNCYLWTHACMYYWQSISCATFTFAKPLHCPCLILPVLWSQLHFPVSVYFAQPSLCLFAPVWLLPVFWITEPDCHILFRCCGLNKCAGYCTSVSCLHMSTLTPCMRHIAHWRKWHV